MKRGLDRATAGVAAHDDPVMALIIERVGEARAREDRRALDSLLDVLHKLQERRVQAAVAASWN